jgi:branched-chain amino acid transport system substrate-binding protein
VRRWISRSAATTTTLATVVVAALVGVVGLTACGHAEIVKSSRRTPDPIHIGAIYCLTGTQASLDSPSLDGARLAVDRINSAGGLLGRRVELLERDGQSNAGIVRYDAQTLAAQHVTAMLGLSDSDLVLAAAPVAAHNFIPFVTSGATSPQLPEDVPNWLFLACFGDNEQAAAGAEFAVTELGTRRIAILYDDEMDYTRLLARYFTRSIEAYGGKVVFVRAFHSGERDVTELMARDAQDTEAGGTAEVGRMPLRAHLIYLAAGPGDAGPLVRKLRAAGYGQPIMGGDSFDNSRLVNAAESSGGGVYFTTHAALGMPHSTAAMRRFSTRYTSAYGRAPENAFAALGYDTVNLVAKAILRAESAEPQKVRDALLQMHAFNGVTGAMSYARDSFVPRKEVTIVAVGNQAELAAQLTPVYMPKP